MTSGKDHEKTDAELWEQWRTASAAKNARRFHANKRGYTIYMDRLGADVDRDNVHWIDEPLPGRELKEHFQSVGLVLGEYHLDMDNNPDWHAVVVVGKPTVPNGDVRITSVAITANALETTALPLAEITRRLFDVGGVVGEFWTEPTSVPGVLSHWYKIAQTADGYPFHPRDIETLRGGYKQRAGMKNPATYQLALDAELEYNELKKAGGTTMRKYEFVEKRIGYKADNVKTILRNAHKWAAENNKEKTK
jgi:hypothetical protein